MVGHGAKFGHKMELAIAALLSHRNVEEAARAVEINPNTLLRWLKEPEFDAASREARRLAFSQSIARLQQASSAAVTVLLRIMADPNQPAASRVRAAEVVLERTARAIEIEDVSARVAELERLSRANSKQRPRTSTVTLPNRKLLPPPAEGSGSGE